MSVEDRHRFRAIIFDFDGTLVDTAPDVLKCANLALRELGMRTITLEDARRSIGPGPDNFARIVLPEGQQHRFDEFIQIFRRYYDAHCLDNTRPFPGIPELLERLDGLPKVIASNKPKVYIQTILSGLGLRGYFDVLIGPEDVDRLKPAPDMLLAAAKALGVAPQETLMVGDTDNDVLAARAAGISVCAVAWGYSPVEDLEKASPDFIIHDPEELLSLLQVRTKTAPASTPPHYSSHEKVSQSR